MVFHDVFPAASPNYTTWGWSTGGDPDAGTVRSSPDGVLLDGTYGGLAYAFRNSPEFGDFSARVRFTPLPGDGTVADAFVFLLRYHDPTFPTQSTCCSIPSASSGIYLTFNVGRGIVTLHDVRDHTFTLVYSGAASVTLGQPHVVDMSYVGSDLGVAMDGTPVFLFTTGPKVPGLFGLEVYRMDMVVDVVEFNVADQVFMDDLPSALDEYAVGGWSSAGDPSAGTAVAIRGGLYLDGTPSALAFALRNSPTVANLVLSIDLLAVVRDGTEADAFVLLLRWKDGTFPPCCEIPSASSGIYLTFNVGRGLLVAFAADSHAFVELGSVPLAFSLGEPHIIDVYYVGGRLVVAVDGVTTLGMRTPREPEGQVGFEVYRMDLLVSSMDVATA